MTKRCKFCARKLNNDGLCTNHTCPDNLRREIIEQTEQDKAKNAVQP